MMYALTGCVPVDAGRAVEIDRLVSVIASYAGDSGPNFWSLFSDDAYASVCFPGVTLDLPTAVIAEIEAEVNKLAAYTLKPWSLICATGTNPPLVTTLWITPRAH